MARPNGRAKKKGHEEREHAPLPPSASHRWLICTPSQGYIETLIDAGTIKKRESGEAAQRGTRIHEIAEKLLNARIASKTVPRDKAWDLEELVEAQAYVEFCIDLWEEALLVDDRADCGVEAKSEITDECWGSCDFWIFTRKRLKVVDLKTGREAVAAKNNTQLLIYAMGIVRKELPGERIEEVECVIYQPNGPSDDPVSSHVYKGEEFRKQFDRIDVGISLASKYLGGKPIVDLEPRLIPGDHCGWCDALGVCPQAKKRQLSIATQSFTPVPIKDFEPPAVEDLEPNQVGEILRRATVFTKWLEAVEMRAIELVQKGKEVPGFKVVSKQTRRAWEQGHSASQLAKALGLKLDDVQETKLKSPAQVEKLLKGKAREKLSTYTFKPTGLPTIAPVSDRREALPSAKIVFKPVTNEENEDG